MNLFEAMLNLQHWCGDCGKYVRPIPARVYRFGKLVDARACPECGSILEVDE